MAILHKFQNDAPFEVRIEQNPTQLGYRKNFEKALSLCTGDFIFLSDQDDYWFDTKILEMTNLFSARPDIFVIYTDMIITDENLNPSRQTQLGNILALGCRAETYVSGCATALRRDWLSIVLPMPTEVAAPGSTIWPRPLTFGLFACRRNSIIGATTRMYPSGVPANLNK